MYNGIGITTPRGTGTNGYVQRNLSFVPTKRERVEYVKDADIKKLETLIEKKGNAEILEHEKKRKIEVKCMEMRDMMLNNEYDEEVTAQKVQKFRQMLIEREGLYDKTDIEYDEFGRPVAKETHQLAQANDEKNRKLREAFGIGEYNQKDIVKRRTEEAKEVERRKAEVANKQYTIVQ
jgi:serine/arginine repetitive matrix protein 2